MRRPLPYAAALLALALTAGCGAGAPTPAAVDRSATTRGEAAAPAAQAAYVSLPAATTPPSLFGPTTNPPVVRALIPYGATRKAQMARYSLGHYGYQTYALKPTAVVLHFTGTDSLSSVITTFASNTPNRGEYPGTCAHFLVAKDGTIRQLVPMNVRCRHAIGYNHRSIGIEIMQSNAGHTSAWADRQILDRPAQIRAVLRLVHRLQVTFGIPTSRVYGHGTVNSAVGFLDLKGWRNDHTDMGPAAMSVVRSRLTAIWG